MDHDAEADGQRGTFLSVVFAILVISLFLFLLFITCGGLFIYILALVGGIAFVGLFHYLLWGHSMTNEVAGEREEEELRESMEEEDGQAEHPGRFRF